MPVRQHYPDRWFYGLHQPELWFPIYRLIQRTIPVSLRKRQNLKVTELVDGRVRSIPGHSVRPLPSTCGTLLLDPDDDKVRNLNGCGVLRTNSTSINCVSDLCKEQLKSPQTIYHGVGEMAEQERLLWLGLRQKLGFNPQHPRPAAHKHLQLRI